MSQKRKVTVLLWLAVAAVTGGLATLLISCGTQSVPAQSAAIASSDESGDAVASLDSARRNGIARNGSRLAFKEVDLVSDQPDVARFTDPNLVNSWGLAFLPGGPLWVADNGTGVSTVYQNSGVPFPSADQPLVVVIPPPNGSPPDTTSTPTGLIANPTSGFVVSIDDRSAPARFIFVTEDGTISGWNPNVDATNAILKVDNSPAGSVYKGGTLAETESGPRLYATDFSNIKIDVFDDQFNPVEVSGGFADSTIPEGFAPFNIKAIDNRLFVTYALQQPGGHDDQAGPGNGFVNIFDTDGNLIQRLISNGPLNSPWGLALVPERLKRLEGVLLVGNFGDGHITAIDVESGDVIGQLVDKKGRTIVIDGLWSLVFREVAEDPNAQETLDMQEALDTQEAAEMEEEARAGEFGPEQERGQLRLYFTAGPDEESHGLLGFLKAVR